MSQIFTKEIGKNSFSKCNNPYCAMYCWLRIPVTPSQIPNTLSLAKIHHHNSTSLPQHQWTGNEVKWKIWKCFRVSETILEMLLEIFPSPLILKARPFCAILTLFTLISNHKPFNNHWSHMNFSPTFRTYWIFRNAKIYYTSSKKDRLHMPVLKKRLVALDLNILQWWIFGTHIGVFALSVDGYLEHKDLLAIAHI